MAQLPLMPLMIAAALSAASGAVLMFMLLRGRLRAQHLRLEQFQQARAKDNELLLQARRQADMLRQELEQAMKLHRAAPHLLVQSSPVLSALEANDGNWAATAFAETQTYRP